MPVPSPVANASIALDRPVCRGSQISEVQENEDLVLYSHHTGEACTLNPTAAIVWSLCDSRHSARQIVEHTAGVYQLDPGIVRADVIGVLTDLGRGASSALAEGPTSAAGLAALGLQSAIAVPPVATPSPLSPAPFPGTP